MLITANNPNRKSWLTVRKDSDFPIQNIPFGVFLTRDDIITIGTRIGDYAIDLGALHQLGYFKDIPLTDDIFLQDTLNDFIADGRKTWRLVRNRIAEIFDTTNGELRDNATHKDSIIFRMDEVEMQLPVDIGDYTDFYASKEHATNVGSLFRDPENALMPNWLHVPIGYHGRSSSIVTNDLGNSVKIEDAEDYIFGLVLFNDWSARDIQAWEYQPLGPFLGKSFASTISPWIVTLDALEAFRVNNPKQDPTPLPYLQKEGKDSYDINLQVGIKPKGAEETIVANSNFKYMYWTMVQQLTHHTVNGCNVRAGDMMGSGTISGPTKDSYGSMLELTWRGQNPIQLNDGTERKFINDKDTVIMRAYSQNDEVRIGFGECIGKVKPAKE